MWGPLPVVHCLQSRSMLAVDVETGKAAARRSGAHAAAINRLLPLSETAVASGDDDGAVHLWDTRQACYRPSGVVQLLAPIFLVAAPAELLQRAAFSHALPASRFEY